VEEGDETQSGFIVAGKQIRGALGKLVAKGVLKKGQYAQNPWDRRTWYSFVQEDLYLPDLREIQERARAGTSRVKPKTSSQESGGLPLPPAFKG